MQKKRLLFLLELNVDAERETVIFLGVKCERKTIFERVNRVSLELLV